MIIMALLTAIRFWWQLPPFDIMIGLIVTGCAIAEMFVEILLVFASIKYINKK